MTGAALFFGSSAMESQGPWISEGTLRTLARVAAYPFHLSREYGLDAAVDTSHVFGESSGACRSTSTLPAATPIRMPP